jgi:large subunit ribosomal protein L32
MNPVQKVSKSRKRKRRSHHALRPSTVVRCAQCGSSKLPHAACGNCGYHNPAVAVAVADDAAGSNE